MWMEKKQKRDPETVFVFRDPLYFVSRVNGILILIMLPSIFQAKQGGRLCRTRRPRHEVPQ